jgi:hydrogenase maturation protease
MPEQAVVGVGNQIMGDDGLSADVVEVLREAGVDDDPGVSIDHAGTTAFFALEAMDGADRAIVIDALQVPDTDPGTVHRMVYRGGSFEDDTIDIHMHDFSFTEAITAAEGAYEIPSEIIVLGMTPADLSAGLELSQAVRANMDELVASVRAELERGGAEVPPIEREVSVA